MSLRTLPRIAISGYYGCGNSGDEAVLMGIRDAFRRTATNRVVLTALSQNPDETTRLHGIDSAFRMDIPTLKREISGSQLLISGGGSLLQDTTSLKSLLYYLYVMRVAATYKVPFMVYAQGIGPLRRPISRKLVVAMLKRAAAITVRDNESKLLLESIGVISPPIEVTADPAFALTAAPISDISAVFAAAGVGLDSQPIGVALRPWGDAAKAPIERYAALIAELQKQTGQPVVMLPMHHPDDVDFSNRVAAVCSNKPAILSTHMPPDAVLATVSTFKAVVALRLHALIFAARCGVPAVALAYDPKVTSLMQSLGAEQNLLDWRDFDPAEAAALVVKAIESNKNTNSASTMAAEREALALRNSEIALSIAGR